MGGSSNRGYVLLALPRDHKGGPGGSLRVGRCFEPFPSLGLSWMSLTSLAGEEHSFLGCPVVVRMVASGLASVFL